MPSHKYVLNLDEVGLSRVLQLNVKVKQIFLLTLIALGLSVSASAELEFNPVPSLNVEPGQVAIHVLPVYSDTEADYSIEISSNPDWHVDGPTELILEAEQAEYLTYSVDVPATAQAGSTHELKLVFRSNTDPTVVIEKKLYFLINGNLDLDLGRGTETIQTSQRASIVPVQIRNSGNTSSNFRLTVENFSPNVNITVNPSQLQLDPGVSKQVSVSVRFPGQGNNFAVFRLKAEANGRRFFSKTYQIKLLSFAEQNDGKNILQTEVTLSNEFVKIDQESDLRSNLSLQSSGPLSDYVGLTAYFQATRIQNKIQNPAFHFDFKKDDGTRVEFGDSVKTHYASNASSGGALGAKVTKSFEDFNAGILVGMAKPSTKNEGDPLVGAFAEYFVTPRNKIFVVHDHNLAKNEFDSSLGYEGHFETEKLPLTFAPSLILSANEKGQFEANYAQTIRYMVRKNLPVVVSSGASTTAMQDRYYTGLDVRYTVNKVTLNVGGKLSQTKNKSSGVAEAEEMDPEDIDNFDDGISLVDEEGNIISSNPDQSTEKSLYVNVFFPVVDKVNGTAGYRFIDQEILRQHEVDLSFQYTDKKLSGNLRFGASFTQFDETFAANNQLDDRERYFASLDMQYRMKKFVATGKLDFDMFDENSVQVSTEAGIEWQPDFSPDSVIGFTLGYEHAFLADSEDDSRLYARASHEYQINERTSIVTTLSGSQYNDGRQDISGMLRLKYKFGVEVPERVTQFFGGRKTAVVEGKICVDIDKDEKCNKFVDEMIDAAVITIGSERVVSDKQGLFKVTGLLPSTYDVVVKSINFVNAKLPEEPIKLYDLRANQTKRIDIALQESYEVSAQVFFDENENTELDDDESLKAGYRIVLKSLSGEIENREAMSSDRFKSNFSELPRGDYELSVVSSEEDQSWTTGNSVQFSLPAETGKEFIFGFTIPEDPDDGGGEEEDVSVIADNEVLEFDNNLRTDIEIISEDKAISKIQVKLRDQVFQEMVVDPDTYEFLLPLRVPEAIKESLEGERSVEFDFLIQLENEQNAREFSIIFNII